MAASVTPLLNVRGLDKTSSEFRRALIQVAMSLGIDPNWLAAVISFESAHTFASDVVLGGGRYRGPEDDNKAVGLIQFTNIALEAMARRGWKVTKAQLANMTPEQQLAWVQRYFITVGAQGKMRDLADVYMAVFAPSHVGKPGGTVLYSRGTRYYEANKGLDKNRDGTITKDEAASFPASLHAEAQRMGPLAQPEGGGGDSLVPFRGGDEPDPASGEVEPETQPPPGTGPSCAGIELVRQQLAEIDVSIRSRLDDIDVTLRDVANGQLELALEAARRKQAAAAGVNGNGQ